MKLRIGQKVWNSAIIIIIIIRSAREASRTVNGKVKG